MGNVNVNIGGSFLNLNDTPSTYVGSGGNICYVNTAETGLTFRPSGGLNYRGLWPPSPVPDPLYLFPDETLTLANSGYYWVVDGDGQDKDGRIWDNGDWIIYNGGDPTLGTGWDQYRPTSNISDKEVRVKAQAIEGTVADFDMVYWNDTSSQWEHALATAAATIKMGIVSNLGDGIVTYYGEVDWVAHGLTIGSVYYLSPTVPGGITLTPPTGVGEIVQPVLQPISADRVFIYDFKLDEATGAGGIQQYTTGGTYAVGEQVYYQTTIYEVTTDIPTAPIIPPWASLKAISSTYQKYTVNDDYKVGDFVEFNDGIYEVVIDIDNAPVTPPWTSLRNANRQVVSHLTTGAVTAGDVLLHVQDDGQVAAHNPYIAPTDDHHLAPKKYVDDNAGLASIPDWSSSTSYIIGAYVRYADTLTLYRCEINHTSTIDFVADVAAGNWSHLTGYVNTAREFQGGLIQQTAFEQIMYMRDNTTPRTPISVSTPGYRDDITPVVQNPPMTVQSTWNLTSSPLLGTASSCDGTKFERRHVSFAGTYFTVGDFIAFGPNSFGPFGTTRWEILRVGRTSGDNYHYAEVSPDNCNVPCQQSPSSGGFQTYRPTTSSGYIDPLAVTAVTDIGGGEFQIDLDDAHDGTGTAVLDDIWAVGVAIMQFDVDDPATYFVIKSLPTNTSVICEPSAALPTTLISNPAGWLPTVGMNLRTTGVAAPLARVTPQVIAVTDLGGGFFDIQYDANIDGTGLNWTVGHGIVPLSDTSGNTYLALQSFTAPDTLMMDASVSFPQFYVPTVGIQMDTSNSAAQPLPTLGEDPRVPVLDGELVNKKYVDDNSAGGVLTGRHTGPVTVNASQYIRLAGPFTPTSGAHFEIHWQFDGGVQAVVVGSWAGQFSAGELRIESSAGSGMGGSYIDTLRIRRADSDGGLYIGYVLDTNQVLESLNMNIKYTQQGNQVPTTHFVVGGFSGTDLASVTLPARTDFRPYLQPAIDGQALNSGSHAYIGAWTAPAEIPVGTLCAAHFSIGFTLGGTAEYTWWMRISTETDQNARGAGNAEVQSLYRGYCAGMLYFTVPAGKRVEFHLRLDGNSGNVQADSGNGRSVFLIQPYQ